MPYTVLDLFAGGGGFSTGFQMSRGEDETFEVITAVELNKDACDTLRAHLGTEKVIEGDITDPQIKERVVATCREVDVIIGGPPCQTYSLAGPSRSGKPEMREALRTDPRNTLFRHFFDLVDRIRPRVVVFENVEGITSKQLNASSEDELSHKDQVAIEVICDELESLGYSTRLEGDFTRRYQILNAVNYKVPQQRKRVIIIANRLDLVNPMVNEKNTDSPITLKEVLGNLPVTLPKISSTNMEKLKNMDVILDNLDRCMESVVSSIKSLKQSYSDQLEVQSDEFNDILSFLNEKNLKLKGSVYSKSDKLYYLKDVIKGYNELLQIYAERYFSEDVRQFHLSRAHNFRDVVIFSMMKQGTSSAQFINKESQAYDAFLDELYPYDRTKHIDTYVKHSWDKPSNTILSHMEKDGLKFIHPDQPRTFTPYEAALIQSFPSDYQFCGGRNAQYRQIGNAVPPLLARSIGESILKLLERMQ